MLLLGVVRIVEYVDPGGRTPFTKWFAGLDAIVAAKVATMVIRMEQGNFSNVKGVGSGVFECRIDFGPGYRVYFGKDGDTLVILLAGGTKKRQSKDVQDAQQRWLDYKRRKMREVN